MWWRIPMSPWSWRRQAFHHTNPCAGFEARALDGGEVMISAAPIASTNWLVVAEQPRSEVLGPLYAALTRTMAAMLAGIAAALAASYFLARRLAHPILKLRRGAEKIAR